MTTDDVSAEHALANRLSALREQYGGLPLAEGIGPQFNVPDGARIPPVSNDDETDLDQTLVATWTSVVSNTKVNTVRGGLTKEQTTVQRWLRALRQPGVRHARCVRSR